MRPLRVGVIGLGIGMRHARVVFDHPSAHLVWLCDSDPSKEADARRAFPEVPFTSSERSVLDDPSLDAVCIASYDDAHFLQADRALMHAKHVFLEKPICLHEHEMQALSARLDANPGFRLSTNLVLRTCPRFVNVKREIDAGHMGDVYHLEGDYFWGRKHKLVDGWRADMEFYSIIHGAAVHMVDLVMHLTGRRPVSVTALGSAVGVRGTRQRHNDFALLSLRFADGLSAKIAAHGGCEHPHFHRLSVFGTRKSFLGEFQAAGWIDSSDPGMPPRAETGDYPGRSERGNILSSFLDTLVDPSLKPLVNEADSFAAMSVCLAAERSVQTRQECMIEYIA